MNTILRFKAGAAPFNAEEVAGVPREEAKRLIKGGYAELYTPPVTKVEPAPDETKVEPDADTPTEAPPPETKVEPPPLVTKVEPPIKRRGGSPA